MALEMITVSSCEDCPAFEPRKKNQNRCRIEDTRVFDSIKHAAPEWCPLKTCDHILHFKNAKDELYVPQE